MGQGLGGIWEVMGAEAVGGVPTLIQRPRGFALSG